VLRKIDSKLALFLFFLIINSCSITNELKDGESVLVENNFVFEESEEELDIPEETLRQFIVQKENSNFLGIKYGLILRSFFDNFGEDLVVFDSIEMKNSAINIKDYFSSMGYFNAVVKDSCITDDEETEVTFFIEPNNQSKLTKINYYVKQSELRDLILKDTINSLLQVGKAYNETIIEQERNRINLLMKNNGYYRFKKYGIEFLADTTAGKVELDISIVADSLKRYKVNNVTVYVNPDYVYRPNYRRTFKDTVEHYGVNFLYGEERPLSETILSEYNDILPGMQYNFEKNNSTHKKLSDLSAVGNVGVQFAEESDSTLNAELFILPRKNLNHKIDLDGTNLNGNIGFEAENRFVWHNTFNYSNKLSFTLNSSLEFVNDQNNEVDKSLRFGGLVTYEIPIIYPFNFIGKNYNYIPKTNIDIAADYNTRPEYDRFKSAVSFGYRWKTSQEEFHNLQLATINIISIKSVDSVFFSNVKKLNLENSYQNTFISSTSYSYYYDDRKSITNYDYTNFRFHVESSGSILNLANKLVGAKKDDESYDVFGINFSQYVKFDLEYKKFYDFGSKNVIATRFGVGVAVPYGNMKSLPIDKQYQVGGVKDIRAWINRSLGPGGFSLENEKDISFYNQLSDMKIIFNLEYRYPIYGFVNGAFFIDAGNIWSLSSEDERDDAKFKFDQFYKQFAVGTGLGIRLDFNFIQLVFDLGVKLRSPKSNLENKWIFQDESLSDLSVFNFGLNYPF
jgi:hypothetical protein